VTVLATRAAAGVSVRDSRAVDLLLGALRAAGADDAVTVLATRAAAGVTTLMARNPVDPAAAGASLGDPRTVDLLLRALREAGADDAVTALATRAAAGVRLGDPRAVDLLLGTLREAGADEAVTALAGWAANAGMLDLVLQACPDEAASYPFGREPDGTPSQPWNWQEPAS
jgi:hypothetical protein